MASGVHPEAMHVAPNVREGGLLKLSEVPLSLSSNVNSWDSFFVIFDLYTAPTLNRSTWILLVLRWMPMHSLLSDYGEFYLHKHVHVRTCIYYDMSCSSGLMATSACTVPETSSTTTINLPALSQKAPLPWRDGQVFPALWQIMKETSTEISLKLHGGRRVRCSLERNNTCFYSVPLCHAFNDSETALAPQLWISRCDTLVPTSSRHHFFQAHRNKASWRCNRAAVFIPLTCTQMRSRGNKPPSAPDLSSSLRGQLALRWTQLNFKPTSSGVNCGAPWHRADYSLFLCSPFQAVEKLCQHGQSRFITRLEN